MKLFRKPVTCPTCDGEGTILPEAVASAPARPSDPRTSHASQARNASKDVGRFSTRSRQARLLEAFVAQGGLTDFEATVMVLGTAVPGPQFDGCRRRCSDLRAAGYLKDSGKTRCNEGSPDESIVWLSSTAGKMAFHSLEQTGWSR